LFEPRIIVAESDYKNLTMMLKLLKEKYPYSANLSFLSFNAVIQAAKKKKDDEMPSDIVKMDSVVTFQNLNTNESLTIKLVYPEQEQLNTFKLSVFSAVGMALFAQKKGAVVACFDEKRKIRLKILDIA